MKSVLHLFTLALALESLVGCNRTAITEAPTPTSSAASIAPSATQALDQMDKRKPVPLLPMMAKHQKENMRDHLAAVQEIISALAIDDLKSVEKAAGRIGFSEQMGAMCTHMGAGAPGFSEEAISFHRTADRIGDAARAKDRKRALAELGATLKTCTACHAAWKQQIVDEATWQSLTSSAPPAHGHDR